MMGTRAWFRAWSNLERVSLQRSRNTTGGFWGGSSAATRGARGSPCWIGEGGRLGGGDEGPNVPKKSSGGAFHCPRASSSRSAFFINSAGEWELNAGEGL